MIHKVWRMEREAWTTRREVRLGVVFLLVATLVYALILRTLFESDMVEAVSMVVPPDYATGFGLAYATARAMLRLLGLFLILWASASIAGELERGTLRLPLLRIARRALPLGKASFLAIFTAALAAIVLVLALGVGAAAYGLEGMFVNEVPLHSRVDLLGAGLLATVLTLLPLFSTIALAICVSCFVRSTQHALTLTVVIGLVLWALSWFPGVGPWMFPATLSWPFDVALSKSEGLKTITFGQGIVAHCITNLAWTGGLLGLGLARFERRDLLT